ncbi:hypothetical protein ACFQY7_07115 [Actinomadura luteofluorescens]
MSTALRSPSRPWMRRSAPSAASRSWNCEVITSIGVCTMTA